MPASTTVGERSTRRLPVLRVGVAAGVVAAVATTLVVVIAQAFDVPIDVAGEKIPLFGFAQLTLVGALLGVAIAKVCARSRSPHRAFVVTTVVLTALSLIPDVTADATTATRVVLGLTHVVAASIVVPALARQLRR